MKSLSFSRNLESDGDYLKTKLSRVFCGAPVSTGKGKILLGALFLGLSVFAYPGFREFYSHIDSSMLAGSTLAMLVFSPMLVALRYFDRRDRKPAALVALTAGSVICFFGPVAAYCVTLTGRFLDPPGVAGFIEEFWKIVPLLLLLIFVPRAVSGTRDGLIYGAFGGFGFAVFEFGQFFINSPLMDWTVFSAGLGKALLLGTHNQIIWSACAGAAIGWASAAKTDVKRYLVPLTVFTVVSLLHVLNDKSGDRLAKSIAEMTLEPLAPAATQLFAESLSASFQLFAGTFNLVSVNLALLPLLFRVLCRSGDTERRIIREQLDGEIGGAITRAEFEGVVADRRYRTRRIRDLPAPVGREIVRMQNELAFHKAYSVFRHVNPDHDPPVRTLRQQIAVARFENTACK